MMSSTVLQLQSSGMYQGTSTGALESTVPYVGVNLPSSTIISWGANPLAQSYDYMTADNSGFVDGTVINTTLLSSEFGDGITPVQSFYYRKRDIVNGVPGKWAMTNESGFVSVESQIQISVSNLAAIPVTMGLNISWVNPVSGSDSVIIEVGTDGITYTTLDSAYIGSSYGITGLTNDVFYYVKVTVNVVSVDYTGLSEGATGTPNATETMPTPILLSITDNSDGSGAVSVSATSPTADTYEFTINSVIVQDAASTVYNFTGLGSDYVMNYSVTAKKNGYITSSPLVGSVTINATTAFSELEDYGGDPFYKHIPNITQGLTGSLTITPYSQDSGVLSPNTSRIVYSGTGFFNAQDYIGKDIVIYASNKFPNTDSTDFFPSYLGSCFSKITAVSDSNTLIVDFEYNGTIGTAQTQTGMYGAIFHDNSTAISNALADPTRTTEIVLRGMDNGVYCYKKMPEAYQPNSFKLTTKAGQGSQAAIKYIAEDGLNGSTFGTFFVDIDGKDGVNYELNVHCLPPIYTVSTVDSGLTSGYFKNNNTTDQWAGELTIKDSQDWLEFRALEADGSLVLMPQLYNFNSPNFVNGIMYGGKRSGDTTEDDINGFVNLNCLSSDLHAKGFSSLKVSGLTAGIKKNIIGTPNTASRNEIVELDIRPNLANSEAPVKLGQSEGGYNDAILGCDFTKNSDNFPILTVTGEGSMLQMYNQTWTGGTSAQGGTPTQFLYPKTGLTGEYWVLYCGNNGDWNIATGSNIPTKTNSAASLFYRIPEVGQTIYQSTKTGVAWDDNLNNGIIGKIDNTTFEIWGWGLQIGDELTYNGTTYTVLNRVKKYKNGVAYGGFSSSLSIHYLEITFDVSIIEVPENITFTISKSQTEFIINTFADTIGRYDRDLAGHLFYDDVNFPFHFKDVVLKGYGRGHDSTIDNRYYRMCPSEAAGGGKIINNVTWEDDFLNSEVWVGKTLTARALKEGIPSNSYPIEVFGECLIYSMHQPSLDDDVFRLNDDCTLGPDARITNPIIVSGSTISGIGFSMQFSDGVARNFTLNSLLPSVATTRAFKLISSNNTAITINNFVSSIDSFGYHGLLDVNKAITGSVITQALAQNTITVLQGVGAISMNGTPDISLQSINISNWVLKSALFRNGIVNSWDVNAVDYDENVRYNGSAMPQSLTP